MMPAACPRLFETEAMRDGRLAGAGLMSFARHTTICAVCRREVQALDALAEALRASARAGAEVDELHALRERTRLIAAFDRTLRTSRTSRTSPSPAGRRGRLPRALSAAVAATLIAAGLYLWRSDPRPSLGPSPGVVVQAGGAAVWSKRSDASGERVTLDRGELWIHVDHSRRRTKLVVALPDGELEDTGTTFTVRVANGRTTRVGVQEGSVVLRLHGHLPATIGGGSVWIPEPAEKGTPTPAPLVAPTDEAPPPPPRRAPSPIVAPTVDAAVPGRARAPVPGTDRRRRELARSSPSPDAPDPAVEFRAAVAVLDVGAHREAAAAFARFLVEHPRDPQAEDAAYLRVIALERCGDADETRRVAQAYLRLYPAGFRRAEIERLSRSSASRTERRP